MQDREDLNQIFNAGPDMRPARLRQLRRTGWIIIGVSFFLALCVALGWRRQWIDPDYGALWYLAGVVLQFLIAYGMSNLVESKGYSRAHPLIFVAFFFPGIGILSYFFFEG